MNSNSLFLCRYAHAKAMPSNGSARMEMDKSQDRLLFAAHKPRNKKPVSLKSAEQTRTDALLEELAEIIESEGGVLIP
jgi:hypothetical protein